MKITEVNIHRLRVLEDVGSAFMKRLKDYYRHI